MNKISEEKKVNDNLIYFNFKRMGDQRWLTIEALNINGLEVRFI